MTSDRDRAAGVSPVSPTAPPAGFWQRLLGRYDIKIGDNVYMERWRLVHRKWLGVRVHHILRSDADRELHDHPFDYVSVILKGGYFEHVPDTRVVKGWRPWSGMGASTRRTWYGPGSVLFRRAESAHRLEQPRDTQGREVPAWTINLRGPLRRVWGFYTADGWLSEAEFVKSRFHQVRHARQDGSSS